MNLLAWISILFSFFKKKSPKDDRDIYVPPPARDYEI